MCKIRCQEVLEGPGPGEKALKVPTSGGGWEEVIAPARLVHENRYLEASRIARDADRVLVELPRESSAGNWRVWVDSSDTQGS